MRPRLGVAVPVSLLLAVLPATACGGCSGREIPTGSDPPAQPEDPPFRLARLDVELRNPVHLAAPAGDARIFVVEQGGTIRILRSGDLLPVPFLDIGDRISSGGERGLLSLAFHPRFDDNGVFFINFTDAAGDTRVERWTVGPDPDVADAASARLVLAVDQPFANHNGGHLRFGPDGFLYVGMGDGGSGGDPGGNGQNRETLLGAILRLDVDAGDPYAIPPGNPFAGHPSFRPEIWAWGVRNPWRIAFDAPSGLLYVADVGQNRREEIDVVPADAGGLNFGWNIMEGSDCYGAADCDRTDLVLPVAEYDHSIGCSVTGGEVYRGTGIPAIRGLYFYADYCSGWLRSFRFDGATAVEHAEWDVGRLGNVVSFGTDGAGELYIVSRDGVFRFDPASGAQ